MAAAGVALLAACGDSGKVANAGGTVAAPAGAVTPGDVTYAPEAPTPPTASAIPTSAPGQSVTIEAGDGSFDLSVGTPTGVASLNSNRWVGIPVTIQNVVGAPTVSASYFGISPVAAPEFGNVDTGVTIFAPDDAIARIACGSLPLFHAAFPGSPGAITGQILDSAMPKSTGCVIISYDASDKPDTVSYFKDGIYDDETTPVASWTVTVPTKATPKPTGTTYTVTSDGGISVISYATVQGQAQDTAVTGTTWTKAIPQDVQSAVVVAQNAGGGTISCTISEDGKEVARQSSNGQYAVVTCSHAG